MKGGSRVCALAVAFLASLTVVPTTALAQAPVYTPPQGVTVMPTPSGTPTVVHYPTGRFELQGDGSTTPYAWVWTPNPPPPPPGAPPSAGEPASATPLAPTGTIPLYRWIDERGVTNLSDRWTIPPDPSLRQTTPRPRL